MLWMQLICRVEASVISPTSRTQATQPMERLSMDFKGPLSSASRNTSSLYCDEFSRFPFAFPSSNMNSVTVIKCLNQLFSLCGYLLSDCGSSFLSQEVKNYLTQQRVATCKTTPYHHTGNSQVERYNGIIWKTLCLALKSANLLDSQWEQVLPDALHSIRSLLTTSTNFVPQERFFGFEHHSSNRIIMPSWLMSPGPVLLCRFVRTNKNDPLVDQVDPQEANLTYVDVRYLDNWESTVSFRDLAPYSCSPVDVGCA